MWLHLAECFLWYLSDNKTIVNITTHDSYLVPTIQSFDLHMHVVCDSQLSDKNLIKISFPYLNSPVKLVV